WANVAGDSQKELIIVGEWMPPRIFDYDKASQKFKELKNTGLQNLYGWWQTVAVADVNGDGKQDLLLGNIGENFYLHPDSASPVKLWINDFDQNNSIEKIMTYTIDGKDKPVFLKKDLEDQLPSIKKSNLKNEAYSGKTIQDLFPAAVIEKCIVKQFNYPSSVVAINNGDGSFSVRKLPVMSQLSCINRFYCIDLNNDGYPDLVVGGNQFGFLPEFERLDGSLGDVLINDRKGGFIYQGASKTGLKLRGEIRDIEEIKTSVGSCLLFLQNNEIPVLCTINKDYPYN
ncbi:MAG TPA: FG-GAP-like repeat-containing protein, partial [Chitinophagaceae bacterium]